MTNKLAPLTVSLLCVFFQPDVSSARTGSPCYIHIDTQHPPPSHLFTGRLPWRQAQYPPPPQSFPHFLIVFGSLLPSIPPLSIGIPVPNLPPRPHSPNTNLYNILQSWHRTVSLLTDVTQVYAWTIFRGNTHWICPNRWKQFSWFRCKLFNPVTFVLASATALKWLGW